jgi:prepilin-type N-terminal cleavage/methylation domain-containing protein
MENRAVKEKTRIFPAMTLSRHGFTLIELTVVLFLVTIISLIAAPFVRDVFLTDSLQWTVNQLTATARALRSDAARNRMGYILHIDLNDRRFWTTGCDATPEATSNAEEKAPRFPGDVAIADIYHFDNKKISEGTAHIIFSEKGYVEPTVLHLAGEDRFVTMIFHPFLQEIEIHDGYLDYRPGR